MSALSTDLRLLICVGMRDDAMPAISLLRYERSCHALRLADQNHDTHAKCFVKLPEPCMMHVTNGIMLCTCQMNSEAVLCAPAVLDQARRPATPSSPSSLRQDPCRVHPLGRLAELRYHP